MKARVFENWEGELVRLGFGAMGLGGLFGTYDDDYLISSVLHALERGLNFVDTARAYGRSEQLLGQALAQWNGPAPFLATKAAPATRYEKYRAPQDAWGWHQPLPAREVYPPGSLRKSLESSLQMLKVEAVDLLQMHNYWAIWDGEDYWLEELEALKREGKTRHIGVSVPDQRCDQVISLVRSGRIDSVQTVFNIFESIPADCLIPICQENNVAVIAREILDEGGLTGAIARDTVLGEDHSLRTYFDVLGRDVYLAKVDALRQYIPEHAANLPELSIKFATWPEGVTVALSSMHVREHLNQNLAALGKGRLPDSVFQDMLYRHRWSKNFHLERKYQ